MEAKRAAELEAAARKIAAIYADIAATLEEIRMLEIGARDLLRVTLDGPAGHSTERDGIAPA